MPERQHNHQPDPQANAESTTGAAARPLTREDARAIARVLYAVRQRRAAREAKEAEVV